MAQDMDYLVKLILEIDSDSKITFWSLKRALGKTGIELDKIALLKRLRIAQRIKSKC
jgi:hypothetical protein